VVLALGVLNLWQRSEILAWQRKRRTTKKASIFFLISGGLLCMWMLTGNPVWDFKRCSCQRILGTGFSLATSSNIAAVVQEGDFSPLNWLVA